MRYISKGFWEHFGRYIKQPELLKIMIYSFLFSPLIYYTFLKTLVSLHKYAKLNLSRKKTARYIKQASY